MNGGGKLSQRLPGDKIWHTVHPYPANAMTRYIRSSLDELGYEYTRDRTEKHYTRFAILFPIPQFAYCFRFVVKEPAKFVIDVYDTRPNHSGTLHHIQITGVDGGSIGTISRLLKRTSGKMDRKPYSFSWMERFTYGIIAPEYMSARSRWAQMGVK